MGKVARHGLIYGAGVLISKMVAFIMLPIYTRYLSTADYGILSLVNVTMEVVSIAAGARLAAGVFHFYHKADTADAKRSLLSTGLAVLGTSYSITACATFLLAPMVAHLAFGDASKADLVRIAAAALAFESLQIIPLAYLQLTERSTIYVAANVARLVLQLSLNIALVVGLRYAVKGVLISGLVAHIVVGGSLAVYLIGHVGMHFSRAHARDLLRFGIPFIGTQIATFVLTFGDRYFLRSVSDVAAVGIYGLAYQFSFLYAAVSYLPFFTAWEPARFEIARRDGRDAVYARTFIYYNVLLVATGMAFTLFVHDGLQIMSSPQFWPAANLVPLLVAAQLIQAWTNFHNLGILVTERTHVLTWANWVGAGVAVAAYALLIPRYYGWGAAWATVAAVLARQVVVYVMSQRLWPVQFVWAPIARLFGIAAVIWAVHMAVPFMGLAADIPLRAALYGVFALAVWHGGVLTDADRTLLVDRSAEAVRGLRRRAGL